MAESESIQQDSKSRELGGKAYSADANSKVITDLKTGKIKIYDDDGNLRVIIGNLD